MTLLVRLARKNNAKVVLSWAHRLPNGQGYELNYKSVDILSESGEIVDDVQMMNQAIESLVEAHPEQYLWNYKRFKSVINYSS
jgi:KDO2-lipid IV(A) lauroyltransferase